MAGYFDATYGDRNSNNSIVNDDEYARMMASLSSFKPVQATPDTGPSVSERRQDTANKTIDGASKGSMAGPIGAGIGAVGGFMTSLMAQKAQDERQRRANAIQIENAYAQNQNQGYDTMMRGFQGALR